MLTTSHEFETIPAFTVIAGSSQGGYSSRELAIEIIKAANTISTVSPTEINAAWKDLAEQNDDEVDVAEFEVLLDGCNLPPCCSLQWHDNEYMVMPDLESAREEAEVGDETPDHGLCSGNLFLVINDHGNATLYQWQEGPTVIGHWREQWGIV